MKEIILSVLASGAFSTVISWSLGRVDKHFAKKDGLHKGMQQTLYLLIKEHCLNYIAEGAVYSDDLEDLERAWKVYHNDLDGNGYLNNLMNKVRNLPIKEVK